MSSTYDEETMKRQISATHPMLQYLNPELASEIEDVANAMSLVSVPPSRAVSLDDNNGSDGVKVLLKRAAKECLHCCGVEIRKKPVEDMIADAVKNNDPDWQPLEHDLDMHIADNHQQDWLACAEFVGGISLKIKAAVGTPAEYNANLSAKQQVAGSAPAPVSASGSTLPSPVKGITAKQRRARSPRPDGCQRGRSQSPNPDRQRGRSRDRSHGRRGNCSDGNKRGSKAQKSLSDWFKALPPSKKQRVEELVEFYMQDEDSAESDQFTANYLARPDGYAGPGFRNVFRKSAWALKAAKVHLEGEAKDRNYRS